MRQRYLGLTFQAVIPAAFLAVSASVHAGDPAVPAKEFVRVPGGCFQMGTDRGEKHEKPVHKACVDSFEIGKYEVTQGQWKAVMGANPSRFAACGDTCPVEMVSWNDAQQFIRALNDQKQGVYRLPTEAEWEYACRSGGKDEIYAGAVDPKDVDKVAWTQEYSGRTSHPVGTKEPNALGIYDMNGNVWEWVQDTFSTPYSSAVGENNPVFDKGSERVLRGGSWDGKAWYVRCQIRNRNPADRHDPRLGLRLVKEPGMK
jgi:formylglycine-generating enzyme required for sulfatase activity